MIVLSPSCRTGTGASTPAVEDNAFHLDLFGRQRLVDKRFVVMDDGVDTHPAGQLLTLADNGLLFDHRYDDMVRTEL